jgi:PKD repeat protein
VLARGQRSTAVALAAVAGLLVLCGSAAGAATWRTPQALSATGENAATAQVAVDSRGDSVAVWDFGPDGSNNRIVQASVRPAGGSWQTTPTNLATCFFFSTTPQVAVDPKGDAIAAFECATGSGRVIDVATQPAGGSWSQPVTISNTAEINVEDPEVAIDANGDATVAWVALGASATSFIEAAERPAGGSWSQPVDVSRTDDSVGPPVLAMDSGGDATAVWTINNGINLVAEASLRPEGATTWSAPVDLSSADAAAAGARVAVTPGGTSVAVWQHGTGSSATVQAAIHPAGGAWQAPQNLSAAGELAESPQLATDGLGNTAAVWDRSDGSNTIVQAAELPAGGSTWQSATNLSAAGQNATVPQLAASSEGDLVAVWERSDGANTIVQGAARPAGGSWQSPQSLSSAGQNAENPQVAVDAGGNATAVWDRSNGTNTIAEAVGYDAGPLFTAVAIPTSGTVGKALAFSATAGGVWSPVSATAWTFGDGQSATGATATHTYATPGAYTVTVTSTDADGGSTSRTQTTTVAAAPKPPPPNGGAPKLTAVSEAHKKWRDGPKHGHKPPPSGTSFSFTVDQPARVAFAFTESRPRHKPRARGSLAKTVKAGHHTIRFAGVVSGHKLQPGAYTVRITAANSSGKRSRTVALHFTLVS